MCIRFQESSLIRKTSPFPTIQNCNFTFSREATVTECHLPIISDLGDGYVTINSKLIRGSNHIDGDKFWKLKSVDHEEKRTKLNASIWE